jgi:ribonucleoside-diphosphate reductase alpha chain
VPEFKKLKNKYDLLWDQRSPEGYLKIMAVLQKYIDQGISVNTSYNPAFYEDEKIPMSLMLQHLLMFYKLGGKQLYYFQTHDGQGELDVAKMFEPAAKLPPIEDAGQCESCTI